MDRLTSRRAFIAGAAAFIAAPAIVRAASLMPIRAWQDPFRVNGIPYDIEHGDWIIDVAPEQPLRIENFEGSSLYVRTRLPEAQYSGAVALGVPYRDPMIFHKGIIRRGPAVSALARR